MGTAQELWGVDGDILVRHSKRTVIFRELHSCPCCRDCDFLFPAQFVSVTWDVCYLICLGSGFPALISMVQCSLIKEVPHPTPPHPTSCSDGPGQSGEGSP